MVIAQRIRTALFVISLYVVVRHCLLPWSRSWVQVGRQRNTARDDGSIGNQGSMKCSRRQAKIHLGSGGLKRNGLTHQSGAIKILPCWSWLLQ